MSKVQFSGMNCLQARKIPLEKRDEDTVSRKEMRETIRYVNIGLTTAASNSGDVCAKWPATSIVMCGGDVM